ncbi:MAG: sugar ABC transporter permease [Eubacteriales bacterium]|nr:sugar ABC transporter permease [Eubacteriales bacterium]
MHLHCKAWKKILLCLPALIIFCIYMIYPICDTIFTSFQRQIMLRPGWFVGFDNYIKLFEEKYFWIALKNSGIITIGSFLTQLPLAYLLGSFLNKPRKNSAYKTISFIPNILSGVMAGLIWTFILDPSIGLFNNLLISFGSEPVLWIGGKVLTPYAVTLVLLWQFVGFHSVLFLAGFKMMPKDTIEAAHIDGANTWQRNLYVILPAIKETVKISAVFMLIGGINQYQQTYMLTGGGPTHYSETLATYTYYLEFREFNFGVGSAMATIILILALGTSIIMLQATTRRGDTA